jgi:hypothetical protein
MQSSFGGQLPVPPQPTPSDLDQPSEPLSAEEDTEPDFAPPVLFPMNLGELPKPSVSLLSEGRKYPRRDEIPASAKATQIREFEVTTPELPLFGGGMLGGISDKALDSLVERLVPRLVNGFLVELQKQTTSGASPTSPMPDMGASAGVIQQIAMQPGDITNKQMFLVLAPPLLSVLGQAAQQYMASRPGGNGGSYQGQGLLPSPSSGANASGWS